jgi:uncharacterized protein YsxB (DUF464 family)
LPPGRIKIIINKIFFDLNTYLDTKKILNNEKFFLQFTNKDDDLKKFSSIIITVNFLLYNLKKFLISYTKNIKFIKHEQSIKQ